MTFPRKPFLDRVMVEVIPIERVFEQGEVEILLNNQHSNVRSDRGIVLAVGDGVPMSGVLLPMPVQVGDEVYFDESTGYAGRFYLKPSDIYRPELPIYLELRVGDLIGRGLREDEYLTSLDTERYEEPAARWCEHCNPEGTCIIHGAPSSPPPAGVGK